MVTAAPLFLRNIFLQENKMATSVWKLPLQTWEIIFNLLPVFISSHDFLNKKCLHIESTVSCQFQNSIMEILMQKRIMLEWIYFKNAVMVPVKFPSVPSETL